jgi:hypothetical protein
LEIKKTKRRKVKDVIIEDGKLFCPHCHEPLENMYLRKQNYGVSEDGKYLWYKKICFNCDNYIMLYSDFNFKFIKRESVVNE